MLFLKVSVFTYFILSVLAGKGVFFEIYLSCILICFVYLTNRSHFPVRSYCNRSRMTSQRMTSQYNSRRSRVALVTVVLYTLWRLLFFKSDYSTHTCTGKCYLFVLYNKNSNGFLTILPRVWGMWEKDKNSWRYLKWFDVISTRVPAL